MEISLDYEPIHYDSINDVINEEIGTIRLNKDYTKEFAEYIADDIYKGNVNQLIDDSKYLDYYKLALKEYKYDDIIYSKLYDINELLTDDKKKEYKELNGVEPTEWLHFIMILCIERPSHPDNHSAYSFTETPKYCILDDECLQLGVISLINPKTNRFLKDRIYHELNHYKQIYETYKNTNINYAKDISYLWKKARDFRWFNDFCLKNNWISPLEYRKMKRLIDYISLLSYDFTVPRAVDLVNEVFSSIIYYLISSEENAHIENIFGEYEKWLKQEGKTHLDDVKYFDINQLLEYPTIAVYNNIESILTFARDNMSSYMQKEFQEKYGKYYGYIYAKLDNDETIPKDFFKDEFKLIKTPSEYKSSFKEYLKLIRSCAENNNDTDFLSMIDAYLKGSNNLMKEIRKILINAHLSRESEDMKFDYDIEPFIYIPNGYTMSLNKLINTLLHKLKKIRKHNNAITKHFDN